MNRALIVVAVLLLLAGYLFIISWTGRAFVSYATASAKLSLDERTPVTIATAEQATLDISGSGFSDDTRAFLHMDINNQDAIVGSFPVDGVVFDMERVGNILYVAGSGPGIRKFDVSNPRKPKMLPISNLRNHNVLDIERSGDRLFLSCGNQGVRIGQIVGSGKLGGWDGLHTKSPALASKVIGRYLYVAAGKAGLLIYDLENLDKNMPMLALETGQLIRGIEDYRGYLYLNGGRKGVKIYKLNDSGIPQPVGVTLINHPTRNMLVADDSLYVLASGKVSQFDLSDPATPQLVSEQLHFSLPYKLYHAGDTIYVSDNTSGLGLIDNRTRRLPGSADFLHLGGDARTIEMIGDYLYVAISKVGIKIIDPAAILPRQVVQTINTPGTVHGFKIIEDNLYIADVKGLFLKKMFEQGGDPQKILSQRIKSLTLVGNYLFAGSDRSGLFVFDVNDPENPKLLSKWPDLPGFAIAANEKYLVLGQGKEMGLALFDISNIERPLVADVHIDRYVSKVCIKGNFVVVAGGSEGLSIYKIEKAKLVFLSQIKLPFPLDSFAEAISFQIVNNIAFVANGAAGLSIIDLSNPNKPEILGSLMIPGFANSVLVENDKAYVASRYSGLHLVDISELESPRLLTTIDSTDLHGGVQRYGDLLLLGNRYMGVTAIPFPEEVKKVRLLSENKLRLSVPVPEIPGRYSLQVSNKGETASLNGVLRFQ